MDVIITSAQPNNITITCDKPNIIYVVGAQPVNVTISFAIPNQVGSQTLAETLILGNETDGEDILLSDGDAILSDNGSKLKKGTTNAGNGGNGGIALKCSLDYEFKWEAGRMYIMQQDGIGIRETRYNFNIAPTVNDDSTKGYDVNSRWILDNGDVYICTDATVEAAIWVNITVNQSPERTVKVLAQSELGDGYNFHSFLAVGNALYGGERSNGSRGARFYKFPDKNDLIISEYIEMSNEGAGIKGFESVTYDSVTGNFYGLLSNTSSIITIPANNISAYTITTITGMPSGCFFRGSGGIVNDGTHLYVGTETIPNSFVLKILISTLAVVDDYEWPRGQIHAANINLDNGYAVFTTSGSDCYLLKVNLSDFTHQELQLNLDAVTDDFAIANSFDFAFIGGEANFGSAIGGVAVDLQNMISYPLDCLPSTGFFYDADNLLVINTSILGFVETYAIFDIIDAVVSGVPSQLDVVKSYNLRGSWVNEFAKSGNDYFITIWNNTDGFGIVKKIELIEYTNPLVSREEIRSRFSSSVSPTTLVPYTGATQDVNLGEFGLLTGNIKFDTTPTNIPTDVASMVWNDTDGTLDLTLKGGNVKLQLGQESVIRVVNKTATNINLLEANYQAVRVTGAQGQRLKVDLAQATTDTLSAETIGLVTETINNNQEGFITTSGLVRKINTTGSLQGETWDDGDILYLSPTTAGRITKVKPTAPNHLVIIGYVIHAHATQGSIFVKVDNGYELDELHNVKITTATNNQALTYTSATDIWENKTIDKTFVGLANVDNTSDANKPVSTATQIAINAKENTITAGTTSQYFRGDKTFQTLNKNAVGLGNVDNTTDANKPVSTAAQTQLNNRKRRIITDTTSVVVSGTTSLTLAKTYELTAGTLSTSGFLDVYMFSSRTGNSSVHSMGLYINTTNNFGTATLIATIGTAGNFNPHLPGKLQYVLKDNLLIGGFFSPTSGSNMPSSATRVSVACNNTSASVWLFVGVTPASGQTITLEGVEILN